ncbi:hypothetical protein ACX5HI_001526 [Proteus mirabilis]|uniref:hypothetical protein n=1 Tax=Proteus mirabilis TaxID=584 RepID=UPI001C07A7A4|nr:hypothetical protein [Proteus mirabilis]MBU3051888.1 hypothetical protein [Proteus mirabilis]
MQGINSTERKINMPAELSENTAELVIKFAEAMAEKLHKSEQKYGYSEEWMLNNWELECKYQLMRHIQKGDPVDVANYCAFMLYHGWSTVLPPMPEGE